MKIVTVMSAALVLALSVISGDAVYAKDGKGNGKGAKVETPGKGHGKVIPPGQIKRYTRGAKLPLDLKWVGIGDLSKWKLKPPGKGNRYIRVGDDILEVTEDLTTVVEAVGIVGDLLK